MKIYDTMIGLPTRRGVKVLNFYNWVCFSAGSSSHCAVRKALSVLQPALNIFSRFMLKNLGHAFFFSFVRRHEPIISPCCS